MSKIIINNGHAGLSDQAAVEMVSRVVAMGKISGEGSCYCYGTEFECVVDGRPAKIGVFAKRLKSGTHKFNIW